MRAIAMKLWTRPGWENAHENDPPPSHRFFCHRRLRNDLCVAVDARSKRADGKQQHARQQRERSGSRPHSDSNDGAGDNDDHGGADDGPDGYDTPQCSARDTYEHDPECNTGSDWNDQLRAFHNFSGSMRAGHRAAAQLDGHAAGNGISALTPRSAIRQPAPELAHSAPRLNHKGNKETVMRIRTLILSGAAMLVFATGSAFAQSGYGDGRYGNGPSESTPSEMQQTDQLNQQGMSGTAQQPADRDQAQYAQPQSQQYNAQQEQYQDQMQQYRNQQQRYRNDRDSYARNLRDWDLAQYAWYYPRPYVYRYGDEHGLRPLYLIAEPSHQLAQLPVEGPGGRWVGRVRNVDIAPDGRPARIEIALNRRVSVWVRPGDLRFDPEYRMLYTDLSREDLWNLPGATIESGPY